jgi:hypothetical protein
VCEHGAWRAGSEGFGRQRGGKAIETQQLGWLRKDHLHVPHATFRHFLAEAAADARGE